MTELAKIFLRDTDSEKNQTQQSYQPVVRAIYFDNIAWLLAKLPFDDRL